MRAVRGVRSREDSDGTGIGCRGDGVAGGCGGGSGLVAEEEGV